MELRANKFKYPPYISNDEVEIGLKLETLIKVFCYTFYNNTINIAREKFELTTEITCNASWIILTAIKNRLTS